MRRFVGICFLTRKTERWKKDFVEARKTQISSVLIKYRNVLYDKSIFGRSSVFWKKVKVIPLYHIISYHVICNISIENSCLLDEKYIVSKALGRIT